MLSKILSAAAISACAGASAAAVVTYDNQADFLNAISGFTVLQEEGFTSGPLGDVTSVTTPSGIVIQSFGATMTTEVLGAGTTGRFLKSIADEQYGVPTTSLTSSYQVWTLNPATNAFAFIYRGVGESTGSPEHVHVTIDFGGTNNRYRVFDFSSPSRFGFAGFISDTAFGKVMFDGSGGTDSDTYHVDEVLTAKSNVVTSAPSVPVPASLPLVLSGLVALGLMRKTRRG